jgi:ribose transport system substrate-binding protein
MLRISTRRVAAFTALLLSVSSVLAAPAKIGVLLKARSAFWDSMSKGVVEAGTALNVDVVVKAPLSESDVAVQVQLLNALVAQGIQALVIAPNDKDILAAPVAAAAAKGIKIVVIDSPLAGKAPGVILGTDQNAAGAAAGRFLAGLVKDTDEVAILKHNQTGGATAEREIGASDALRTLRPKLVIHGDIYASSEPGTEGEKTKLLLRKHPAISAVLASSTPGTLAMLKEIQAEGLAGKVRLVGFGFNLNADVAAAIEAGAMQAWIAQLPKDVGYKSVETALALINGQAVPPVIHTDFLVITKDNLKDARVQALLNL